MFDREKFKNLVHYVIHKAGDRDGFGATKLYKVIWFSEGRCFLLDGAPIAAADYIREKHGPVPRLGRIIRSELVAEGKIKEWKVPHFNHEKWNFKSISSPFPLMIDERQKKCVDYWIDHIDRQHSAASISEESHDYAWEIAKMGEPLPFSAVLAERTRRPTGAMLDRARQKARELGLI